MQYRIDYEYRTPASDNPNATQSTTTQVETSDLHAAVQIAFDAVRAAGAPPARLNVGERHLYGATVWNNGNRPPVGLEWIYNTNDRAWKVATLNGLDPRHYQ